MLARSESISRSGFSDLSDSTGGQILDMAMDLREGCCCAISSLQKASVPSEFKFDGDFMTVRPSNVRIMTCLWAEVGFRFRARLARLLDLPMHTMEL